jgi:probable rRNA maturation factor
MILVQVDENLSSPIEAALVEKAAQEALDQQRAEEGDLTVVLTGDAELQSLNLEYLGIDAPTDVLSFPADFIDPDTDRRYYGDILISIARAQAQAQAASHPVQDEILLLTVHGVLHLLGHDHAEEAEKQRMWAAQAEILDGLRGA